MKAQNGNNLKNILSMENHMTHAQARLEGEVSISLVPEAINSDCILAGSFLGPH